MEALAEEEMNRQPYFIVRRIRDELREKDPRCHWCQRVTLPASAFPHPDSASLDHLKSRWECPNKEEYQAPSNHVLSCLECNQLRDKIEQAQKAAVVTAYLDEKRKKREERDTLARMIGRDWRAAV